MQCPMCASTLHLEHPDRYVGPHDHLLAGEELERAAAVRVTVAFWMAIDALESQAEALRAVGRSDSEHLRLADQADDDARVLRDLARGSSGGGKWDR